MNVRTVQLAMVYSLAVGLWGVTRGVAAPTITTETTMQSVHLRGGDEGRDVDRYDVDGSVSVRGETVNDLWYQITPRFRWDSEDRTESTFDFLEDSNRRPAATMDEVYAAYYGYPWEWIVGKRIYGWGVGDVIRPMDVANPRDYLDLPDVAKIGVPSVSVFHHAESVGIQLIAVPWFVPSRIPEIEDVRDAALGQGVSPVAIMPGERVLPKRTVENMQGGVRVTSSSLLTGWDVAVCYWRGRDKLGVLQLNPTAAAPTADLLFPEIQQAAASCSTAVKEWELHAEAGFRLAVDESKAGDYVDYVVGTRRTWQEPWGLPADGVTWSMEYVGEEETRGVPSSGGVTELRSFVTRALSDSVYATVLVDFTMDTTAAATFGYNHSDDSLYIDASVRHRVFDHVQVDVGVQSYDGPNPLFFGQTDIDARFQARLTLFLP